MGLTQSVCLPVDPADLWAPFQPPTGDKKGFGSVLLCIPPSYCSEKIKGLSEQADMTDAGGRAGFRMNTIAACIRIN